MKRTTRKILAIALVVTMVFAAGCAGWGADGPADTDTENETNESEINETNQSDELNETNETNESETNATGPDGDTGDADEPASEPEQPPEDEPPADDKPEEPEEPKQPPEDDKAPEEPEQPPKDKPEDPEQPPEDGKTHTLTVEVVNGETGEPIEADGEIGIGSPDHQATESIEDGKAVFEGVPAGQYGISADIPGHTMGSIQDHEVIVEGDTTYTLEMYPEPEEHTLTVTVVDGETAAPIEGAVVQGFGSNPAAYGDLLFAAKTGEDGTGSGHIVEGKWSFEVHADGYEFVQGIALTVDSDEEITIELQPEQTPPAPTENETNETNETAAA